jgi:hypothetical protein
VVLAHAGALYHVIAFGSDEGLQADHRAALSSLRFIPRLGAFPSLRSPEPHPFATAPTLALTGTGAGSGALTVRAAGHGYLPQEANWTRAGVGDLARVAIRSTPPTCSPKSLRPVATASWTSW